MIQLEIDCIPVSWSAAQKGKYGFYDKKYKEKEFARWQIQSQYRSDPIEGPVSVEFIFHIPIPKSISKSRRKDMLERRLLPESPDTTNMQKLYEDCLQGIVIGNDKRVNKISSVRFYSEKPGVIIKVRTWQEETGAYYKDVPQQDWLKV